MEYEYKTISQFEAFLGLRSGIFHVFKELIWGYVTELL